MRGPGSVATGLAALALAGCASGPAPTGRSPAADEAGAAASVEAGEHEDARFLVDYAGMPFRVNVRYVALIDESVIAVRRGAGEAAAEGWPTISVEAGAPVPGRRVNYADERYEPVVLAIANAVQAEGGICENGASIEMARDDAGEVRTLHRSNRQVWVVFALCPEQIDGQGSVTG
ncbi:MAG: hypothetical protein ACFBWO_10985 [Paracoccaceae bacterium]